ncbi:glycosyltransferase family 1 protein [Halorubrum sp. SS5]|nr:glycosyltransferase family 1 protein [Halorubrum sp. SS5]
MGHILNLTGPVSPDNIEASVNRFESYFAEHQVTTAIFSSSDNKVKQYFDEGNMDCLFLGDDLLRSQRRLAVHLLTHRKRYDIIHVYGSPQVFAVVGSIFSLVSNIPIIVRFNGYKTPDSFIKQVLVRALEIGLVSTCDKSVFISRNQRKDIFEDLPIDEPDTCQTIPPGIDERYFEPISDDEVRDCRRQLDVSMDAALIGTVVNPRRVKRLDRAVDIVSKLSELIDKKVYFAVVGEGPLLDDIESYAEEQGIGDEFIRIGRVNNKNLKFWYTSFDVTILTSEVESFGMSITESYLCETPCVVYDTGGMADQVLSGQTGYCVPPYEVDTFAERIASLVTNESRSLEFGRKGRKYVQDHFTLQRASEAYLQMVASLSD